jgi:hypothetical protein
MNSSFGKKEEMKWKFTSLHFTSFHFLLEQDSSEKGKETGKGSRSGDQAADLKQYEKSDRVQTTGFGWQIGEIISQI